MDIEDKTYFHKSVLEKQIELLRTDQLAHALILSGNDGCGHLELAIQLANAIVSEKISGSNPTKVASAKTKTSKHIHPDIHFSFPFIGSTTSNEFLPQWRTAIQNDVFMNITQWMMFLDAENKQANINAKECNNIIQKLGLKSFESEYKVLLMWLPEYLGKEGNRLLKLIEEPPENTVFILVTEQVDRILNTIISRCQVININNPTDDEIKNRLVEELGENEDSAKDISFLAQGNYRLAKNMSQDKLIDYSEKLFEWLRMCYKLKPEEAVSWCNNFSKLKKEQHKYFVNYALNFFRAFLMMDGMDRDQLRFHPKEIEVAQKLKRFIDLEAIETIEELLNNSFMMIERNANVKMLFMRNSLRIHELFHSVYS